MPFSLVSHYLPLEEILDVISIYAGGSLHRFHFDRYGIEVRRTLSLIRAMLLEQHGMKLLGIMGNSPILQVKSLNVDRESGRPMELSLSRFKGIATQLTVEPI